MSESADTDKKVKRPRKKATADPDLLPIPFVQPANAMETFLSMPELFRHCLTYLDGKSLSCMARVHKGWTYDVAAVMYGEVDSKQLTKMSHATTRRKIACNAVKTVLLRPGWCTDAMRTTLRNDPATQADWSANDRHYKPALVKVAINTILKRCPNVRRLIANGRSAKSTGSRWTATFDATGATGHIDLLHDAYIGEEVASLIAPDGFTIYPRLAIVGPNYGRPSEGVASVGKFDNDIEEIDRWVEYGGGTELIFKLVRDMAEAGKSMTALHRIKFDCAGAFSRKAYDDLAVAMQPLSNLCELSTTQQIAHAVVPSAIPITRLKDVMTTLATNHPKLENLSICMSWDIGVEHTSIAWPRNPNQLKLQRLFIRLNSPPSTHLFSLAAFLSCFMAKNGVLELEWRKQNGKRATSHPLKEVVQQNDAWHTANITSVLGVYTGVIAAFHRLAERSTEKRLPADIDYNLLGVYTTRDVDHLTYDATGALLPIFESLVPSFLSSCDCFVPNETSPSSLFDFVRESLANADSMVKLHQLISGLDGIITAEDMATIAGLSDLRAHVRKGGLKLRVRLQKVENDKAVAAKAVLEREIQRKRVEVEKGRTEVKKEKGQPSGSRAKLNSKASVSKAKAASEAKDKAKVKVHKAESSDDDEIQEVKEVKRKRTKTGSYYVKDNWIVVDDESDEEGDYVPSSP